MKTKIITIPFVRKCLYNLGLDATKIDDSLHVTLGDGGDLVIQVRRRMISVAMAIPSDWDLLDDHLMMASITMAQTALTKVFICKDGDDLRLWFSAECYCNTREGFEPILEKLIKQLIKTMKTFCDIRDNYADNVQALTMTSLMMDLSAKKQPS